MKPKNFFNSVNCACEGIIYTLKTQKHMRVHFASAILVIFSAMILNVSVIDFLILSILITFVIITELINTAVEITLDEFKKDFHISVKHAKDISAGAVLLSSVTALFGGIYIFSKYIFRDVPQRLTESGLYLGSISLLMVVISVILLKAYYRRGRPLRGGMPSGHSACAFSFMLSVLFSQKNIYINIAVIFFALIVSLSRYYLGIHKKEEVLYGAFVGTGITYLIFVIFSR
ncbi:MAG: diacylglycerol kinase [Proteobacteria bacterium]|nr:diacylglycerol kinase [Pseudomonadota bacterium]